MPSNKASAVDLEGAPLNERQVKEGQRHVPASSIVSRGQSPAEPVPDDISASTGTEVVTGAEVCSVCLQRPSHKPGARPPTTLTSCGRAQPPGRPKIPAGTVQVVFRLASENPTWGYRQIHGSSPVMGIGLAPVKRLEHPPAPRPRPVPEQNRADME